jgi:hypothetical protein
MAVAIAGVNVAGVTVGAVGGGATLDAAKACLTAAVETMQSASTIETRRITGDVPRRRGQRATRRKASDRSDQSTAEGRTAGAQARWVEDHRRRDPEEDQRGQAEDPEEGRTARVRC